MNKESVEIINRLRAILQDSWVNELPDNEKIAINFNKSELKLILNCISKERPAPVRIDRGLFGYDIVCSHCSSMLKKLPIYDEKEFLDVLKDSSYYLGKHCRYCGQALDLSPVEKFKEDLRTMNKTMNERDIPRRLNYDILINVGLNYYY